jgi:hypothetical protein
MKKNQYLNRHQCPSCPKWFSERRYLTNHLKSHEINEYIEAFYLHKRLDKNLESETTNNSQLILTELDELCREIQLDSYNNDDSDSKKFNFSKQKV